MRVVLDTNCLIMAISSRGIYYKVWQDFLNGKYTLCLTNDIVEEYSEVIARNISPRISDYIITAILNRKNVRMIAPTYSFHLINADEDDNKFVDCAIISNARYIVSQDHHFDVLRTISFPKVDVITIKQFAEDLAKL